MADLENNQSLLQEEYMKNFDNLQEGALIEGTVLSVTSDSVNVGIGYKSDGIIPLADFAVAPKVGETIKIMLVRKESSAGMVELSKSKADALAYKEALLTAFQEKKPVNGKITKVIKGGYEVDLGHSYVAFLPISKTDTVRVENPDEYLGLQGQFILEKLILDKKNNIVVNRRELLEAETLRKRDEFLASAKEGDIVEGVPKSFTSFGAFVDLGGFDGLLHMNDMSWGHVTRPKDFVSKGEKLKLKVIKIDPVEKKINLSLKEMTGNPWDNFSKKFKEGDAVKGTVTKLMDFGAFIEIAPGIEGLAHISELSWVKRISHPKEILKIGDVVDVKILGFDLENKKVSLGLKQLSPNPWDQLGAKFPVGKILKLVVKKVTPRRAFLNLEEGIDGSLHADDMSWTKRIEDLNTELKEGQTLEVKVIGVDSAKRQVNLGVKQITDDPWNALKTAFPRGSVIEGTITKKADFGILLKVQGDIEGLIPKSNLVDNRDGDVDEVFKKLNVGDSLKVVVMDLNVEKQRLSLSLKDYEKAIQKEEISKYIQTEKDDSGTFTLGDLLKKK